MRHDSDERPDGRTFLIAFLIPTRYNFINYRNLSAMETRSFEMKEWTKPTLKKMDVEETALEGLLGSDAVDLS